MLPEYVKSGEEARLIPVVADTSKEGRVLSVTLAMLTHIPELAHRLFSTAGLRIGKQTRIETFTEVVLKNSSNEKDRPDGMVVLTTRNNAWTALIEAKIGGATLDKEQIIKYAELAKTNHIDAVITISNEFTALAQHHPTVNLKPALSKHVSLYHWPWMWVRTQAELIELEKSVDDVEQKFLLREFIRFLKHPSTGVDKFKQMPKEWRPIVNTVRDGGELKKGAPEVEAVVSAWQQETKDLALDLSRYVGRRVDIRLTRKQKEDISEWHRDGCAELINEKKLNCSFLIPDTAGSLDICANVASRTITCSMKVGAPKDKKSTKARVNWLLRQLKEATCEDVQIKAIRQGKAHNNLALINDLRENQAIIEIASPDIVPTAFEVILVKDLAGKFSGSQVFVQEMESIVPLYYDQVVQYLKEWQAPPPKPVTASPAMTVGEEGADASEASQGDDSRENEGGNGAQP